MADSPVKPHKPYARRTVESIAVATQTVDAKMAGPGSRFRTRPIVLARRCGERQCCVTACVEAVASSANVSSLGGGVSAAANGLPVNSTAA